jgi:hypothetical protein
MVVARTISILRNNSLVIELHISKTLVEPESKMIRRWDNSPHHKELPNFPHHLHDENDILSGGDVNLIDVLMYIETEIGKNAPQHPDPSNL